MKLHLLAIPKDYPKSTATAFFGRTYEGQGPRQPEDKASITTACGKTAYFRSSLSHPADISLCNTCLQHISTLPEEEKIRVLVVAQKTLNDKLEDWEIEPAGSDEIERRINLIVFRLRIFDLGSVSYLTNLATDKVETYLTKLVDEDVLIYDETSGWYQFTDNQGKLQELANKVMRYHQEDGLFERVAEEEL